MIRARAIQFLKRISDVFFQGRNNSLIWLGTDRKDKIDSGYGDGGKNHSDSSAIYIGVGLQSGDGNISFVEDTSHIYLSEKMDMDDYFAVERGPVVSEEPGIVVNSDNVYILGRGKVKIIAGNHSIILTEDGVEIESENVTIKSDNVLINNGGDTARRIITEDDIAVGVDPVTGGSIECTFKNEPFSNLKKISVEKTKIQ